MDTNRETFYIKKEDCRDIGWAYEIDGRTYAGNLMIENLGKPILVKGYQIVEGYQRVECGKAIVGHCKWTVYYTKTNIKIGCKSATSEEWTEFFKEKKTFETDIDSLAYN